MTDPKAKYRINRTPPTPAEKRRKRIGLSILLIILAGLFILFYEPPPGKYDYWNNLITKDPKPDNVSDAEYRAKNRAGYCWRDRKFYRPEELHRKAMASFAGKYLAEAEAFRSNVTMSTQGGKSYTSSDCNSNDRNCRVWFIPQDYSNAEWDKIFHTEFNPADGSFLEKYQAKEIKQPVDLLNYLSNYPLKGFSLNSRGASGQSIFGSNCCAVMTAQQTASIIPSILHKNKLATSSDLVAGPDLVFPTIYPESHIPGNIEIKDYGVGNFYLSVRELITNFQEGKDLKDFRLAKSYQWDHSDIFLMNNCGDVLWYPHY